MEVQNWAPICHVSLYLEGTKDGHLRKGARVLNVPLESLISSVTREI